MNPESPNTPAIPEEVRNEIENWLRPFFPDVPIEVCSGPVDQQKRNTIQWHKRNCLLKGAEYGYSIAQKEISTLEATIQDQDRQLIEKSKEIERLGLLIEKAFDCALADRFTRNPDKVWEQFCKANNIQDKK